MNATYPKKKYVAYLKSLGLEFKRQTDNHEIWNYIHSQKSLSRPVVFRKSNKDIPRFHIKENLKTLGISIKDFERDVKNF